MRIFFLFFVIFSFRVFSQELESDSLLTNLDDKNYILPTYSLPKEPISFSVDNEKDVSSVPAEVDILKEIFGSDALSLTNSQIKLSPRSDVNKKNKNELNEKKGSLLTKLEEFPKPNIEEDVIEKKEKMIIQNDYADKAYMNMKKQISILKQTPKTDSSDFVMPKEIKISFYPGVVSFSGRAVKWVKALALKIVQDPVMVAEIRSSSEEWKLQKNRIAMLVQLLVEQGVSLRQIKVLKTERDKNTILISWYNGKEGVNFYNKDQKIVSW